jgi:hypothetical protein
MQARSIGAWSDLFRNDRRGKKAPLNLSITKAQAESRIFEEVKQFKYTLFAGIPLSGGG